jgi:antitoxin component YwqK of YwqJK toxin-antitoxin module
MKHVLTSLVLAIVLISACSSEVTPDELVERDGLYYEKGSDVPFTGMVKSLYENGQLMDKGNFKDGEPDGPWVFYHENGQLSEKGNYKDGSRDGPWVEYYENGQLWAKGNFKDDKRDGPWEFYEKDGTKYGMSGTYRDGIKID